MRFSLGLIARLVFISLHVVREASTVSCWNAKCTWDATATTRQSCTLETPSQCTGQYCVSYFVTKTTEALQCIDNLAQLSGVTSCSDRDKCVCSSTISSIACLGPPALALVSGSWSGQTIFVNESSAQNSIVAAFAATDDNTPPLPITLTTISVSPTQFFSFFQIQNSQLTVVSATLDYEGIRDSGLAVVYTVLLQATTAAGSSSATFTVSIVDVNEKPTSCTDAQSTAVTNGAARIVPVASANAPLTATTAVDTITCTDPDKYNSNYRAINATLTNFLTTFTTPCTTLATSTTASLTTNACSLTAAVGVTFDYNTRTSYDPTWVISQAGSSYLLTTTSSLSVTYSYSPVTFNASKPSSYTYQAQQWPIPTPIEVFNFYPWTIRPIGQATITYAICSSTSVTSFFSISSYTGKLFLTTTTNLNSGSSFSVCVSATDGIMSSPATTSLLLTIVSNQPPGTITIAYSTDAGTTNSRSFSVPWVTPINLNVLTLTASASGASRFLFRIVSFIYEYDAPAFSLTTTDSTATLVMRNATTVSASADFVNVKVTAIGTSPNAELVTYTNFTITKATNYRPYIETATITRLMPNRYSDNSLLGEFYASLYRSTSSFNADLPPTVTFDRKDLMYALTSVNDTNQARTIISAYWYRYLIRIYSLPATRFDFGPFSVVMTVGDSAAMNATATITVDPVDTFLARDSAQFNFCLMCVGCDAIYMGTVQRCAINETFCCTRSEPGSITTRYCSSIQDWTDNIQCCQGKLCNSANEPWLVGSFSLLVLLCSYVIILSVAIINNE